MTLQERLLMVGIMLLFIVPGFVVKSCEASDYRVGFMPTSRHFVESNRNDGEDWNESHDGVLLEYKITEAGDWLGVMTYHNSIDETSWTVYGANDSFLATGKYADAGIVYGAVTGYDFGLIPYVLPTMTVKFHEHFKSRVLAFPIGVAAQFYIEW